MERRVSPCSQFSPYHAGPGYSFADDYGWAADKSDFQCGVAVPDDDAKLSSSGDGPIDATSFLFKYLNNNPRDYKMGCQSFPTLGCQLEYILMVYSSSLICESFLSIDTSTMWIFYRNRASTSLSSSIFDDLYSLFAMP